MTEANYRWSETLLLEPAVNKVRIVSPLLQTETLLSIVVMLLVMGLLWLTKTFKN